MIRSPIAKLCRHPALRAPALWVVLASSLTTVLVAPNTAEAIHGLCIKNLAKGYTVPYNYRWRTSKTFYRNGAWRKATLAYKSGREHTQRSAKYVKLEVRYRNGGRTVARVLQAYRGLGHCNDASIFYFWECSKGRVCLKKGVPPRPKVVLRHASTARARPATGKRFKLCNATLKASLPVASMHFAGGASWTVKGWLNVKRGKCIMLNAARSYAWSGGTSAEFIKRPRGRACVRLGPSFRFNDSAAALAHKTLCARRQGSTKVWNFFSLKPGQRVAWIR